MCIKHQTNLLHNSPLSSQRVEFASAKCVDLAPGHVENASVDSFGRRLSVDLNKSCECVYDFEHTLRPSVGVIDGVLECEEVSGCAGGVISRGVVAPS